MSGYTQLMLLGWFGVFALQQLPPLFNPFYFWAV